MPDANLVKPYTRIVSTADGGSAFEDAELHLSEEWVTNGEPGGFVGALGPSQGGMFVRFGAFPTDPHPAAMPMWVIMLRGEIDVQVSDGTTRRFGAGDLLLAADTSGWGHVTLMVGNAPFEAMGILGASTD